MRPMGSRLACMLMAFSRLSMSSWPIHLHKHVEMDVTYNDTDPGEI